MANQGQFCCRQKAPGCFFCALFRALLTVAPPSTLCTLVVFQDVHYQVQNKPQSCHYHCLALVGPLAEMFLCRAAAASFLFCSPARYAMLHLCCMSRKPLHI